MNLLRDERVMLVRHGYGDAQKLIEFQKESQASVTPLLSDPERLKLYFVGYIRAYLHYAMEPPAMIDPRQYVRAMIEQLIQQVTMKNKEQFMADLLEKVLA